MLWIRHTRGVGFSLSIPPTNHTADLTADLIVEQLWDSSSRGRDHERGLITLRWAEGSGQVGIGVLDSRAVSYTVHRRSQKLHEVAAAK